MFTCVADKDLLDVKLNFLCEIIAGIAEKKFLLILLRKNFNFMILKSINTLLFFGFD